MINIYKDAGDRIFAIRMMRGYTRESLAELADISPKFLYEIETGKKGFSALVLYNLCKALQVNCDYVMTGSQALPYDQNLTMALELFKKENSEQISTILRDIYELIG